MAKKKNKGPTVYFLALGCPKNVVDSEKMLAMIAEAGYLITPDHKTADIVIINTCGFIEPAKAEAIEAIEQMVKCKRDGSVKKVIVAGCLSERLGAELLSEVGGVDAVVGLAHRDNIVEIIDETVNAGEPAVFVDQACHKFSDDTARLLITSGHWAYLRISEGCDHSCSFCTIPAIRGPFRSKPQELILAEAEELASAGIVELNVIAQDSAYYGRDLKIKDGLSRLVNEIEKIAGPKWIRLMYMYPAGITERVIETIANSRKIVHYLDIPIQHINDEILKNMRRPDTKQRICGLIERLRATLGDIVLRTTVIVGFPGETDEQFEELLDFIRWAKFDALGAFGYYREAGTAAAEMANQVPEDVKQQRIDELMLVQQQIAFDKNKSRISSELMCLVDSVEAGGTGYGRFYGQAPDIDSICIIKNCSAKSGDFVKVKVVDTIDYDLLVKQI